MEGDPLKEHSHNHIAFELNADEFDQNYDAFTLWG